MAAGICLKICIGFEIKIFEIEQVGMAAFCAARLNYFLPQEFPFVFSRLT